MKSGVGGNMKKMLRTFDVDQNTTASQSHFFEEPLIDHAVEGEIRSEDGDHLAQQFMHMNQSAVPMQDYTVDQMERFMRSQAFS